jgi:shikimate kinase
VGSGEREGQSLAWQTALDTGVRRLNFILIGIPGSGKTTLGKKAADALGMKFYDTDTVTSERVRSEKKASTFSQFTSEFVKAEKVVVQEIAKSAENAIIATGAETALFEYNVQALRQTGRFIYIKRDPDRMLEEIREQFVPDPESPNAHDMRELMVHIYRDKIPEYEKLTDLVMENDGDEAAGLEKLTKIIREFHTV